MNKGSCLCGDITWDVSGPLSTLVNCHCTICRKAHGAGFATFAVTPADSFRWTGGDDKIASYKSSPNGTRSFCSKCGSVVPGVSGDIAFMPAGNLEGDIERTLDSHIFVADKAPWHDISDDAPQFDAYPPEFGMPSVEFEKRPAAANGAVAGSCLCGAVAYEFDPPGDRMVLCHCSRCRRSRSAAHSAQIFVSADRFRWTRGEDQLVPYKVPEAKYFAPSFCRTCGSLMPRVGESGVAIIPAGSLDQDPDIRPQLHIFVDSKAPWFAITDSLPQFGDMPPRSGD